MIAIPSSFCKNRSYIVSLTLSHPETSEIKHHERVTRATVKDAVSRNITVLLENLLMNYESSQLPTHGQGKIPIDIGPSSPETNRIMRSVHPNDKSTSIVRFFHRLISFLSNSFDIHIWDCILKMCWTFHQKLRHV